MTLTNQIVKNIILRVIKSQDYRVEIVNTINDEFLKFTIDFFKKIVLAKFNSKDVTIDWYKKAFINESLSKDDIAVNAGINTKTITNMRKTANRTIVIEEANKHFDSLYNSIQELVSLEKEIDLNLTIKIKGMSVDLNVSESLIVINTLAVKRAALRGGLWSTAGKSAEKYLMLTLCKLYQVSENNYNDSHFVKNKSKEVDREIDFYLLDGNKQYSCEVKLMGKGNPESADAIFARKSDVFIADTLSEQNKNQCKQLNVNWVALGEKDGYKRFELVLENLKIPHKPYNGNLNKDLPKILDEIL